MSRRGRGRPYQPYPPRRTNWAARVMVLVVGIALVLTVLILSFSR